jgi:thiol-disulfide isomerase/thioredoxin
MSCGCGLNQNERSGAMTPILALVVLAAPVVGAVLYMGAARATAQREHSDPAAGTYSQSEAVNVGWTDLSAATFDGETFSMGRITGSPAILYFWATWCPQCKVQREVLGSLSREWGDQAQVIALTVDDDVASVRRYLERHTSLSRELQATPELLRRFSVDGLPTLVVIDANGTVRSVSRGLSDAAELRRIVSPLRS